MPLSQRTSTSPQPQQQYQNGNGNGNEDVPKLESFDSHKKLIENLKEDNSSTLNQIFPLNNNSITITTTTTTTTTTINNNQNNQPETIYISKINLSPCDESDSVSMVSGPGDSVSMVAVNSSTDPLKAISIGPKLTQMLSPEDDESNAQLDEQSNQAVASVQNISRALVSDIMSNTFKS